MTIGELVEYLNFRDQKALSNFFTQRSGMNPLAYRDRQ